MPKKKQTDEAQPLDFESSMAELEKLIESMESGDLSLEQSLKDFERGIELTRACQKALDDAQQRVEILLEKSDTAPLDPFDAEA